VRSLDGPERVGVEFSESNMASTLSRGFGWWLPDKEPETPQICEQLLRYQDEMSQMSPSEFILRYGDWWWKDFAKPLNTQECIGVCQQMREAANSYRYEFNPNFVGRLNKVRDTIQKLNKGSPSHNRQECIGVCQKMRENEDKFNPNFVGRLSTVLTQVKKCSPSHR
jgi:hypothetical protein